MSDTTNRRTISLALGQAERRWLIERAAEKALREGSRPSLSAVVRDLMRDAQAKRDAGHAA